jgi:hypothetical protein
MQSWNMTRSWLEFRTQLRQHRAKQRVGRRRQGQGRLFTEKESLHQPPLHRQRTNRTEQVTDLGPL